jgi:hypothetical protein
MGKDWLLEAAGVNCKVCNRRCYLSEIDNCTMCKEKICKSCIGSCEECGKRLCNLDFYKHNFCEGCYDENHTDIEAGTYYEKKNKRRYKWIKRY